MIEVKKTIRDRAKAGLNSFGLTVSLPCPSVIELAALAGYDFVRIDCEHALLGRDELRELLTTARLVGIPCQVRVSGLEDITPLLAQEPLGIMVPHVDSPEQAQNAINCCKFAPLGERGMDGSTRLMRCGGMKRGEYMAYASQSQDLIVQLESRQALERMDEILALPGIDMVATGRADLSQSLGVPGQKDHPDVIAAEDRIIRCALAHGKIPTIAADGPQRIRELEEMGVHCFLIGRDEALLAKALKKNLQDRTCGDHNEKD